MRRVLVANRGEAAVRVIRACRELGLETVAVFSTADRHALHTRLADSAVCIGPAPAQLSYLKWQNVLAAALASGADAIHPGYGFLSENAMFAEMCAAQGIAFIGPSAAHLELLGDKPTAKRAMENAGVPVLPGSPPIASQEDLLQWAEVLGYPVLLKARSGGGGRGMRLARNRSDLLQGFAAARQEALAFFGDDGVYLEKYLEPARHVEVQIIGDQFGNLVHFGERECSLQRRYQKLLEECPSTAVSSGLRSLLGEAALRGVRALGYYSLGTVEFLLDEAGNFYFVEMNPRLQVEHGLTELVYGVDLVKEQIRVARGEPLEIRQKDLVLRGHALECRINAETVVDGFRPSSGVITRLIVPGGFAIRWDSYIYQGCVVPPYYDSLLAKLAAWGENRDEAVARLQRALDELVIEGVDTTVSFHRSVLKDGRFRAGFFSTSFVDQLLGESEIVG